MDNLSERLSQLNEKDRSLVIRHLQDIPEDSLFVAEILRNMESSPKDPSYSSWLKFNLNAVQRGDIFLNNLENEIGSMEGLQILDVGAGSGGNSIAFSKRGCKVTAIEPDSIRQKWLEARMTGHGIKVKVFMQPFEKCVFPNSFDLVYCNDVLEHISDWKYFLQKVIAINPRFIYLSWPNKLSPFEILSDSHYALIGTTFLTGRLFRLQELYLKLARIKRNAWVFSAPLLRTVKNQIKRNNDSYEIRFLDPASFKKISDPEQINFKPGKIALKLLNLFGMSQSSKLKLVRYFAKNHSILLEKIGEHCFSTKRS